uniref:DUF3677 domain-containing protein n=1 Tax=Rhabditophanes sp. KR3021 TaxID=114890 RepID=A0AC35TXE5_9BILA
MNFITLESIFGIIETTENIPLESVKHIGKIISASLRAKGVVGSHALLKIYARIIWDSPHYPAAKANFVETLHRMSIRRTDGSKIFGVMLSYIQPQTINFQKFIILTKLNIDSPVNCSFWDQKLNKMFRNEHYEHDGHDNDHEHDEHDIVVDLERLGMCSMSLNHVSLMNVNYVFLRFLQFYNENDTDPELVQSLFNEWLQTNPDEPDHIVPDNLDRYMWKIFKTISKNILGSNMFLLHVE